LPLLAVSVAVLAPVRGRTAPVPWRPDRAAAAVDVGMATAGEADDVAPQAAEPDAAPAEVVPAAFTEREATRGALLDAILRLHVVAEHRDARGALVRLARDPGGALVRYVIRADGTVGELELWPAAR
jgi:hypothetical protein